MSAKHLFLLVKNFPSRLSLTKLLRILFGIATVLSAHLALAESPSQKEADYMWSQPMQQMLYELAQYMDKAILGKTEVCESKVWLEPISAGLLEPLVFAEGATHPNQGVWTIRYRFDRCDTSSIYNVLFKANPDGPPTVLHMPPGTTLTSPQLMVDLNPAIMTAANAKNTDIPDCELVAVTDTSVTREPGAITVENETLAGVWEEKWVVRTCAETFSLNFCFIPEKSGGVTWSQSTCEVDNIANARRVNQKP